MRIEKNVANQRSSKDSALDASQIKGNTDDKEGYYIDRMHINYESDIDRLKLQLPIVDLDKESRFFRMKKSTPRLLGYKTRVEVVAPTKRFLEILEKHAALRLTPYTVTYIEIAHDVFYPSEREAEYTSYNLFKTLRKKYSRGYIYYGEDILSYDGDVFTDEDLAAKRKSAKKWRWLYYSKGLFAWQTFYSVYEEVKKPSKAGYLKKLTKGDCIPLSRGPNSSPVTGSEIKSEDVKKKKARISWFKLVIYARRSKINWKPCIHYEWRIKSAGQIRKRTGIRTIHDLLNFDFKTFFKTMEQKYIVHEQLDTKKIGRVLVSLERKRKLTKHQLISIDIGFAHFASYFGISSISDYTMAIRKELQYLYRIRGPKTSWAKKISKLSKFGSYIRPL